MGDEVTAPPFLTSVMDGGERSTSRHCRITTWKTVPGTHVIGHGWNPEPVRTLEKNLALAGIEPSFLGLPVSSSSLCRLDYPVSTNSIKLSLP
jgi:hypothetical protein